MKCVIKIILIAAVILFQANASFALMADPSGVYAFFKDAKFGMYADYQYFGKHFNERDINKYNGNNYIDPDTGEEMKFSDEIETFQWHELFLYPKIVFNDRLEFHMKLEMGDYIFSEDLRARVEFEEKGGETYAKEDREKISVTTIALEMVTPVGLFMIGRFRGRKMGVIYGMQLPNLPTWTFALAWLKKNEGMVDYYGKAVSSEDKDDQSEFALAAVYDDAEGFSSRQWIEGRIAQSQAASKNTRVYVPQWELEYQKNNLHFFMFTAFSIKGLGVIAEVPGTPTGNKIQMLEELGKGLAALSPAIYFPDIRVEDVTILPGIGGMVSASYRFGRFEPGIVVAGGFGEEFNNWYEVPGGLVDRFDRKGYPIDGRLKTLLTKEVEDRYYHTITTLAKAGIMPLEDQATSNLNSVSLRAWYDFSEKWEMFNQITGNWRGDTKFYKQNYWDQFPLQYSLLNTTEEELPMVFMLEDEDYYLGSVDPFVGWEYNGHMTYHMFDGLDVSLLYAYFKSGNFYQQVLEPKDYMLQRIDLATGATKGDPEILKGPYTMADDFQITDAWSVQFKVDFRFEI